MTKDCWKLLCCFGGNKQQVKQTVIFPWWISAPQTFSRKDDKLWQILSGLSDDAKVICFANTKRRHGCHTTLLLRTFRLSFGCIHYQCNSTNNGRKKESYHIISSLKLLEQLCWPKPCQAVHFSDHSDSQRAPTLITLGPFEKPLNGWLRLMSLMGVDLVCGSEVCPS